MCYLKFFSYFSCFSIMHIYTDQPTDRANHPPTHTGILYVHFVMRKSVYWVCICVYNIICDGRMHFDVECVWENGRELHSLMVHWLCQQFPFPHCTSLSSLFLCAACSWWHTIVFSTFHKQSTILFSAKLLFFFYLYFF